MSLSHRSDSSPYPSPISAQADLPDAQSLPIRKPVQNAPTSCVVFHGAPIPPCQRLVVVLPLGPIDLVDLPKRIWNLALDAQAQVLLLGAVEDRQDEFSARVNLSILAAVIRDEQVPVQIRVIPGESLVGAASQASQPGDLFVCFADSTIPGFFKKKRLADLLAQKLAVPLLILQGSVFQPAESPSPARRLGDLFLLATSMACLIAFFILQVWIDQHVPGTWGMVAQVAAVLAEIWLIALCAVRAFR